jgi:hypothetical protein
MSPAGFVPYNCTNLSDLAKAADDKKYRRNVGFVCFANDSVMRMKLAKLQVPDAIKLYGLDSIEMLQYISFLEN